MNEFNFQQIESTEIHNPPSSGTNLNREELVSAALNHYQNNQTEQATEVCLTILKQQPDDENALYLMGTIAYDQEGFQKSIEYFQQAVQASPESWKSHYVLGCALSSLNYHAESILHLRKALLIEPGEASIHFELGFALEKCQEFQSALNCYDNCLQLDPAHVRALTSAGNLLFQHGHINEAEPILLSAIHHSSDDPLLRYNYAEILKAKGNFKQAEEWLQSILKTDPQSYETFFSLADIYLSRKDYIQASYFYKEGLAIHPEQASAWVTLGCIAHIQEDLPKSKKCYEKAIAIDPDYVDASFNLGNYFRIVEQYPEAIACYKKVLEQDPNHHEACNNLGIVHHLQENIDLSIECYRKSIEINPEKSKAYGNLEFALFHQKRYEELIPVCEQAIQFQTDQASHHYYLGMCLLELDDTQKAILHLDKAVKLSPNNGEYHYSLGNSYKQIEEFDKAIASYLKALEYNPDLLMAQYNLANTYKNKDDFEQSLNCFQELLKNNPNHVPSLISMSNILRTMDRIEEAKEILESVLVNTGNDPTLKLWITSLCPKVVNSVDEITAHHQNGIEELKRLSIVPQQLTPEELISTGTPPSYFLQFHGLNTLPLKKAYGHYYDKIIKRPGTVKLADHPSIGIFVTEGHEGVFIRYMGRVLEQFLCRDFDTVILCSKKCMKNIKARISVEHLKFQNLSNRFDELIQQVGGCGLDVLYHWEVGSDLINYSLPFYELAPFQMTSVGLPESSGIPQMSHFLSSKIHEDNISESHYSEELILGKSLLTVQNRMEILEKKKKSDFQIPENKTIYFCGQKVHKFHPDFDSYLESILENDFFIGCHSGHLVLWCRFIRS